MEEIKVNDEHKDRLFKRLFGSYENRQWTLELYNAVNGTSYTNADDITITTVEDALYLSMRNDVSFLIADTMSFYEHQSSFNPNMPVRMLMYAGMVYSRYMDEHEIYIYGSSLKRLPVPKLVCFYNGTREMEASDGLFTICRIRERIEGQGVFNGRGGPHSYKEARRGLADQGIHACQGG